VLLVTMFRTNAGVVSERATRCRRSRRSFVKLDLSGSLVADVFVSDKGERRLAARRLAKVLSAFGFEVWHDYGLIPGDDFEPRLMAKMAAAKTIVVLWCSMAIASQWVNKEAREAKRTQKDLPCRIESTALPKEFAAAETINLTEWDGAPPSHLLDRLVAEIAHRLGRDPVANFNQLRELDEDWRGYGAPSQAQFALGKLQTPDPPSPPPPPIPSAHNDLSSPPAGLSPILVQQGKNAQGGKAKALFHLAWSYANGHGGLPKDEKAAVRLYKLAAQQGNDWAQKGLRELGQNG